MNRIRYWTLAVRIDRHSDDPNPRAGTPPVVRPRFGPMIDHSHWSGVDAGQLAAKGYQVGA